MESNQPKGARAGVVGRDRVAALGVFTTNAALAIRTWDDWLVRATGISADAARGRPLVEIVPDLAARGLLLPFQQVLERGAVEILAPAFHRYLIACPPAVASASFDRMQQRVTIGPLREDGRVIGTIVAIEDVTARVECERELAAQLSHADPDVRLRAARLLGDAEPVGGVDPLVGGLADEDWRVRRAAVTALSRRTTSDVIAAVLESLREDHRNFSVLSSAIELLAASDIDVIEPLLELLRYPDTDLRLQAALVLGERGDPRAIGPLIETLSDPDENLRFHAIEALGKLKATAAADRLAAIAESGDFFLAFPALEALAHIGDAAVAPRLARLITGDLLRGAVVDFLGRIGEDDVAVPLTEMLNEATAPTEMIADALANVYDRYEARYKDGGPIAQSVRLAIAPTGTQNLLDAVQNAGVEHLRSLTKVLGWLEGPAVERALTRLLGNAAVRGKVVEYLVRHGSRVVDLLIEQLSAEDLDTRHAAVAGLGRIGDRRATRALIDVLAGDPALTVAAAGALARIGDPDAFEPLFALIGHDDAAVRQAVIAALNSIGHVEMAGRVRPLLRDPEPRVRESAVRIAGYFGYQECTDDLLACCDDRDAGVQRAALEHLAFFDDPRIVPELIGELRESTDPQNRAAAARALTGVEGPLAAAALIAALTDSDPWVRYFAARGLGVQREQTAVDDLSRLAFDDPAGQVRLAAIDALGYVGNPAAIPALAALTASDDPDRAQAAIRALGGITHEDAREALRAARRADDDAQRAAAAHAIARHGGADAVELLEWTAAADESGDVVAAAVEGLASIAAGSSLGGSAVLALVDLTADAARRDLVIRYLGGLPPAAIEHLAQGLRDPRVSVRMAVLQALGRMRHVDASKRIQSALEDESAEVRLAALSELRHLGTRGVERRVVTLARTDPDTLVRRAALTLLNGTRSSGARESDSDGAAAPGPGREP